MKIDNIQQNNIILIGPFRTPIQKISKSDKQQIKSWIDENEQSNSPIQSGLLLRAYLSIGENPPAHIVKASTIDSVLELGDILRYSKKLCLSSRTIEADVFFIGLKNAFQKLGGQPYLQLLRKNISGVKKWMKWADSTQSNLSEATEVELLNFLIFLVHQIVPSKRQSEKKLEVVEKMVTPLLDISLRLSSKSLYPETLIQSLELLQLIREKLSSSFLESVLENESRHRLLEQIVERIPDYVKKSAQEGRVDRMEVLAKIVKQVYTAESQFRITLRELWESEQGTLTEAVQRFTQEYLEIRQGIIPSVITLVDQNESLHIAQLAASLLCSWDAREDSLKSSNAFQVLYSVAQKFFNLKICGHVGNVVQFNPKAHEFPNAHLGAGNVQIIRPWVEWTKGAERKVIIRAIVEAVKQDMHEV